MVRTSAVALAAALVANGNASYPPPRSWPLQHTHTEIMYTPSANTIQYKPVYYDFVNLHYRADLAPITDPETLSFSSYWLNTTLYMYTFPLICVQLEMGFGMMKPGWFVNGTQIGAPWLAKKSDAADNAFHETLWAQTSAGDQGNFDYYSLLSDGSPFRMSAPSPTGLVINEYYNFTAVSFAPNASAFALPSTPGCIPINGTGVAGTMRDLGEVADVMMKFGVPQHAASSLLTDIALAHL